MWMTSCFFKNDLGIILFVKNDLAMFSLVKAKLLNNLYTKDLGESTYILGNVYVAKN